MKKKFLSVLLAGSLLASNASIVLAADAPALTTPSAKNYAGFISEDTQEDYVAPSIKEAENKIIADSQLTPATSLASYTEEIPTNHIKCEINDSTGKYTLVINYAYNYTTTNGGNGGTYAQIRNIQGLDDNTIPIQGDVVIPSHIDSDGNGTLDMPVVSIKQSAFEGCTADSISIPETVHEIQDRAFMNCPNLKKVSIYGFIGPDAEGDIPDHCLVGKSDNASNISSIIGSYAFSGCSALTDVYIQGFMEIGDYAFQNCVSLKNVDFNMDNQFTIAKSAQTKTNLTIKMGDYAFSGCSALEQFSFPVNFKTIGKYAFVDCESLKSVYIGPTLTGTLNRESFTGCDSLEKFEVYGDLDENEDGIIDGDPSDKKTFNSTFMSLDGVLYKRTAGNVIDFEGVSTKRFSPSTLIYYPRAKSDAIFVVNELTYTISEGAFYEHPYLEKLYIDSLPAYKNVKQEDGTYLVVSTEKTFEIGDYAFYGAPKLETVDCSDMVNIGTYAFSTCPTLSSFKHTLFGGSVSSYAFSECPGFTDLSLYGFDALGKFCFANCSNLSSITLDSTGTLGNYCFTGCESLKTADIEYVFLENAKATFGSYVFKDCSALTTVEFPADVMGISTGTFQNCISLETVNYKGEDIALIASYAFDNCPSLKAVPYSKFLVRIDANAFVDCTSLVDCEFSRSVFIINAKAFVNCPSLKISTPAGSRAEAFAAEYGYPVINIEDTIVDKDFIILDYVKKGKDKNGIDDLYRLEINGYRGGFSSLTIPMEYDLPISDSWINNSLYQSVNASASCSMKNYLEEINFGGATEIGKSAFSGTKPLKKAIINEGLTTIWDKAFNGCTSLEGIVLPSTLGNIIDYYHYDPKTDTYPIVPAIGMQAFNSCTALSTLEFVNPTDIPSPIPVIDIDANAFSNCKALVDVDLPYYLRNVGEYAFSGCSLLERVRFSPRTEDICSYAFQNCNSIEDLTIQAATFIDDYAFAGCTGIKRIVIPPSANAAPSANAFSDCVPSETSIVCATPSKAADYAEQNGYQIELAEFVEGLEYATIKGRLTFPEEIKVVRNGSVLNITNYVVYNDKLEISLSDKADPDTVYTILVNGEVLDESGIYRVMENENVEITVSTAPAVAYGDANGDNVLIAEDAAKILQKVLNTEFALPIQESYPETFKEIIDVDGNGEVTASDGASVLQKVLNSEYLFDVEL